MRTNKKNKSKVLKLFVGLMSGCILSLIFLSVCALIVTKKDIAISYLPVMVIFACAAGSAACAFINTKHLEMRGFAAGIINAGCLSAVYLILLFIFSGFSFSGWMPAIFGVDLLAGAAAGIAAKNLQ